MTVLDSVSAEALSSERNLERFLQQVRPRLRSVFARHRIPPEDAEDILQQTLLALVYQWEKVRDPEAWLMGTVRNQCRLYWRRKRRLLYDAVDAAVLEWLATPEPSPQDRRDLWHDLEASLQRLPERCQRLLRLRYQLGYDAGEVADRMGYSRLSISKITHRCLAALARQLVDADGDAGAGEGITAGRNGRCADGGC